MKHEKFTILYLRAMALTASPTEYPLMNPTRVINGQQASAMQALDSFTVH